MTTAPTPLHQECADFATSLRSASSVAMATRGAAPSSFLRAAGLFESAAAELRRMHAENERLLAQIHKLEMDALDLASENSILKRQDSELEARKPLPPARVDELMAESGYLGASAESRADFINGLRHGEAAHGITGGSS